MNIAIIGAGPSGVVAARSLISENPTWRITLFERRSKTGGVWNYEGRKSAMYRDLVTNIPAELMSFNHARIHGDIFPHRSVVVDYLRTYALPITHLIKFNTSVTGIVKKATWEVMFSRNDVEGVETFDRVVLANGHYEVPRLPCIPGINEAITRGFARHSMGFDYAEEYEDLSVMVVGNGPSAKDIISQIKDVVKKLFQSVRTRCTADHEVVDEIISIDGSRITLASGRIVEDVDKIIFCTGYQYSLPFLTQSPGREIITDGERLHHVYLQMIYTHDTSLALLANQTSIVPFPLAEAQSCYLARLWNGRIQVPSIEEMERHERMIESRNGAGRGYMKLGHPEDGKYIEFLRSACEEADRHTRSTSMTPCAWAPRRTWLREHTAELRNAWEHERRIKVS